MSLLSKVQRGRTPRPPRLLVYGTPGIGKSTFGSQAPSPVFVPTEDGLDEIDCAKFPLAATLDEVLAAIAELRTQPHDFETVVLDSLDWLERLIWDRVCAEFIGQEHREGRRRLRPWATRTPSPTGARSSTNSTCCVRSAAWWSC
ncbi:MAG: hypothetical protein KatS3mg108_0032 [Isosphaeraceae bacterium]|nr:MAG: hypothetical protein KatS3mg108_0032 [Isosphaeraceae bacterium]